MMLISLSSMPLKMLYSKLFQFYQLKHQVLVEVAKSDEAFELAKTYFAEMENDENVVPAEEEPEENVGQVTTDEAPEEVEHDEYLIQMNRGEEGDSEDDQDSVESGDDSSEEEVEVSLHDESISSRSAASIVISRSGRRSINARIEEEELCTCGCEEVFSRESMVNCRGCHQLRVNRACNHL